MNGDADIAAVGALLAEPARVEMLQALCERDGLPASELARRAGVSAATASSHLARLLAAGIVTCESQGRHRIYRVGSRHVGRLLEAAARVAPPGSPRGPTETSRAAAIRCARTCYDHLAGRLGVQVTAALLDRGVLRATRGAFVLAEADPPLLRALGVPAQPGPSRRPIVRACLDWSERRPHLAGQLGAALADRFLEARWVVRVRDCRAVRLTDAGRRVLQETLGVDPSWVERPSGAAAMPPLR